MYVWILQYNPELVLVSAGYDSAIGCPEVGTLYKILLQLAV